MSLSVDSPAEFSKQVKPAERLGYLGMALFLGSLLMTPVDKAEAATFTVGNTNDSGAGSLRQAVIDANGSAGADTIVFSTGVTGSINLNSQIDIADPVTITGPGLAAVTVSGQNNTRLFSIDADTGTHEVLISGLTLTNGRTSGDGGAIYTVNTHLTLDNCTISFNYAAGAGGLSTGGGGVFFDSDYNSYYLTVTNSTFSYNACQNRDGGAIYAEDGIVTLTDCTFDHNTAGDDGGAFASDDLSDISIANCTFQYNQANGGSPQGGGGAINLKEQRGPVDILDSTISFNSTNHVGGGIAFERTQTSDLFTITNSTIEDNDAFYDGGGIFSIDANLEIADSTISDNSTNHSGGGVFLSKGNLTIDSTTFDDNSANDAGGGIFFYGSFYAPIFSLSVSNSTISSNFGDEGGGIYAEDPALLQVVDCLVTGNDADEGGGGIYVDDSFQVQLTGCLIDGNTADDDGGGGIHLYEVRGPVAILNSVITANSADDDGGGIYVRHLGYNCPLFILNTIVSNNSSDSSGGGIGLNFDGDDSNGMNSDITIDTCFLSGNSARGAGGALSFDSEYDLYYYSPNDTDKKVSIKNSRILNNFSVYGPGGGIAVIDAIGTGDQILAISTSTIANNYAQFGPLYGPPPIYFGGGGIFMLSSNSGLSVQDSTLSGNGSFAGGGINILYTEEPVTLSQCTFSGNLAVVGAGVLARYTDSAILLRNCTIAYNYAYGIGGGVVSYNAPTIFFGSLLSGNYNQDVASPGSPFYASDSLFETPDGYINSTNNNLLYLSGYLEPLAGNGGSTRTHALSVSSPAIDAGVNAALAPFDQRGNGYPRTVNGQTDMGAFEFNTNAPPPSELFGFGGDTDGDGFSDDAETAAGTDSEDPTDTPLGSALTSENQLNPLSVLKLQVGLKFSATGSDTIKVKGRFQLPDATVIAGETVLVDVAGNSVSFQLDNNPRGAKGLSGLSKIKVGAPKGGVASFVLLMKGDFQAACAKNADLENETTDKVGEARIIRVALLFGQIDLFRTDVVTSYKATQGKSGRAK